VGVARLLIVLGTRLRPLFGLAVERVKAGGC
jgi:hypothetical protein